MSRTALPPLPMANAQAPVGSPCQAWFRVRARSMGQQPHPVGRLSALVSWLEFSSARSALLNGFVSFQLGLDPEPRPLRPNSLACSDITPADRCLPSSLIWFGGNHQLIRSAGCELRHAQRHPNADQGDPCEQRHDER
jgi:hypothetical protein